MTKDEAIALAESHFWEQMTLRDRAMFQLHEELLCMPFDVFHEAVEKTLGRPVFTHEFARMDSLRRELNGERPPPTLAEIMDLIPADKRIVVVVPAKRAD
jgi:hypothetical protein